MSKIVVPEKLDYRIGLDIGIASVGWAVLENNSNDEPIRIIDWGVRLFDKAENEDGSALAEPRRIARSTRRRLHRRKHRLERIKWLLQEEGFIDIEQFMERYRSANLPDVYQLRYESLDRKLTDDEFAQVLLHIAKHRGFKSTRKAERTESKENGAVLKATEDNKKMMEEKGYRTVGEMLYCDAKFKIACPWNESGYIRAVRNTTGDYKNTIKREMLVEEVKDIFKAQRALGNEKATEAIEERYLKIMESQRSFDLGPGNQPNGKPSPYAINGYENMVGKCTFEPEEKRAAKATYTAELFVALQKINHMRLVDKNGISRGFTEEERELLMKLLHAQKEIKYSTVRSKLNIAPEYRFNTLNYSSKKKDDDVVKTTENTKFISMSNYYELNKKIGSFLNTLQEEERVDFIDKVESILTLYKNDDTRTEKLESLGMEKKDIEAVLILTPSGFQHLSLKAMRKIMPYLRKGLVYDKACAEAGYDFKNDFEGEKSVLLKGDSVQAAIGEIRNPVVKRSVLQTIRVINAIIQKYGSPQAINIELAREMSKDFDERKKISDCQKKRFSENEEIKKEIQELGIINPRGKHIIKYRLWHEQQGYCMYSGKPIHYDELFKDGVCEIDHILPYSRTFDDSYRNKVLVIARENQKKGNRTPYEYFGNDEKRWCDFENRVGSFVKDYAKQRKLLKKDFSDKESQEFKKRNLNDTRYITTVVHNLICRNLKLAPCNREEPKKQVMAVNGVVTAQLRKFWGIQGFYEKKNRDVDKHHAVDAVVVACCTDAMIQKVTRYFKANEIRYSEDIPFEDEEKHEIFKVEDFSEEQWSRKFGVKIPRPWEYFLDELQLRLGDDPFGVLKTYSDIENKIRYPEWMMNEEHPIVRPIFVSRKPRYKITGVAHEASIHSIRPYQKRGVLITKTPLTKLKLKNNEIEGYYNKESDWLLYNALRDRLVMYGGDASKAFKESFYKPKADGTDGPIVKKVKIEKCTLAPMVQINNKNGIAKNGSMIRIDVFCENGKYYFVPIYTNDVVKKMLPNKAATANKPENQWKVVDDKDFVFSLYSRDLVHIRKKGQKANWYEEYVYYKSANTNTASISGIAHDSRFEFGSLGIQNLELLEKCQVDILGNISIVKNEKRMGF